MRLTASPATCKAEIWIASAMAGIRAGRIYLNGAPPDRSVPFGDYKQSGNREHGIFGFEVGFEEYLEVKAVLGYRSAED